MTTEINLVIVEGCDNSGKSTFIKHLETKGFIKMDIPKKTKSGDILKIDNEESLTAFVEMFKYVKPGKYVLDRSVMSNSVYDRVLRHKSSAWFNLGYLLRMAELTNLSLVVLDRNPIEVDYTDDLIDLDNIEFNSIIQVYQETFEQYKKYSKFQKSNIKFIISKILEHDNKNNLVSVNKEAIDQITNQILNEESVCL